MLVDRMEDWESAHIKWLKNVVMVSFYRDRNPNQNRVFGQTDPSIHNFLRASEISLSMSW